MKPKVTTVDEYIKSAPPAAQSMLKELRKILKSVKPDATEAIKWGYPVLIGKRILFSFSAFKTHINFMPTRSSLNPFLKELKPYKTGKDTIQFNYDEPLPHELITKIAKYRVQEVEEGALWMHNPSEKKS